MLSIFLPAQPTGHGGAYEPDFDSWFGPAIAAFVDPDPAPR
jgi:hypothetical protein